MANLPFSEQKYYNNKDFIVNPELDTIPRLLSFNNCYRLKTIIVPNGVQILKVFNCPQLKNIKFAQSVNNFQYDNCPLFEFYVVPNHIQRLSIQNNPNITFTTQIYPDCKTCLPQLHNNITSLSLINLPNLGGPIPFIQNLEYLFLRVVGTATLPMLPNTFRSLHCDPDIIERSVGFICSVIQDLIEQKQDINIFEQQFTQLETIERTYALELPRSLKVCLNKIRTFIVKSEISQHIDRDMTWLIGTYVEDDFKDDMDIDQDNNQDQDTNMGFKRSRQNIRGKKMKRSPKSNKTIKRSGSGKKRSPSRKIKRSK